MNVSSQSSSDRSSQMLAAMKPGSVVVDLAAENGGNCVATVPGQLVEHNGVTVIGWCDPRPIFKTV
jgi:proton-translocating NAD(P)+ transhydrogenase